MSNKHVIVYAEDDQDDFEIVLEALNKENDIELIHAEDGAVAIDKLKRLEDENRIPCLIILDVNMPLIDGKQVLVFIRTNNKLKDVPVTVFTTSSSTLDKIFAQKWKADFVTKPINITSIDNVIKQFVRVCSPH